MDFPQHAGRPVHNKPEERLGIKVLGCVFLFAFSLAFLVLLAGCGVKTDTDSKYVQIYHEIKESWPVSMFTAVDKSAVATAITESLNGNPDGSLLTAIDLTKWLNQVQSFKCRNDLLEQSRKNLIIAMELEIQGISELDQLFKLPSGTSSEEVSRRVTTVFSRAPYIRSKLDKANSAIDEYEL